MLNIITQSQRVKMPSTGSPLCQNGREKYD